MKLINSDIDSRCHLTQWIGRSEIKNVGPGFHDLSWQMSFGVVVKSIDSDPGGLTPFALAVTDPPTSLQHSWLET